MTVEARFDRRERERTEVRITGLPDPVIRESRDRLTCALEACGLHLEQGRLFLNLVPAARRKSGEMLDLPLVLAAAAATGHLDARHLSQTLFLGEVGIDGQLHAVPGGLAAAMLARERGLARLVAPPATAEEAAWIEETACYAARDLNEVFAHLYGGEHALERAQPKRRELPIATTLALDDVRGQATGKLALTVAAAGGHGMLLVGPPGSGKSMLAQRLATLLPAPSREESLELTCLLSAMGRWPGGLARERPFRAPHHTVSYAGLVGGGSSASAGEITLAHRGVLFLDELPEFRRETLEALRQPLESGTITISRAGRQAHWPASFHLVAAMNPCPCGYHGHPRTPCTCPPTALARYRQRISGPLLDRIDLRLELRPVALDELIPRGLAGPSVAPSTGAAPGTSAAPGFGAAPGAGGTPGTAPAPGAARTQEHARATALVHGARARQLARQGARLNSQLDGPELDRWAALDAPSRALLERAARRYSLSARALQSLRRVARTLADMHGQECVGSAHISQAVSLRATI